MAIAQTPTLLSLDGFAKMVGVNPVHFAGAKADTVWDPQGACQILWPQHPWQGSRVISREEVAQVMHSAEVEVANVLGYAPAPRFEEAEEHPWPRDFDRKIIRSPYVDARNRAVTVNTTYGKVISAGRRKVTLVEGGADVVYSDLDGDSWKETATITVSTTVTEPSQLKLFFFGRGTEPVWEIRPLRSVSIANGVATIRLSTWLLIDPDLWDVWPSSINAEPIDITTVPGNNLMQVVDVYQETVDTTAVAAVLGSSHSHALGQNSEKDGTFSIRSALHGQVVPVAATYNDGDGNWTGECEDWIGPDYTRLWYYAGEVNQAYLRGATGEPMPPHLAEVVAMLTAARLSKPICQCSVLSEFTRKMQQDVSRATRGTEFTFVTPEQVNNPFGTRYGEIMAWNRLVRMPQPDALMGGGVM